MWAKTHKTRFSNGMIIRLLIEATPKAVNTSLDLKMQPTISATSCTVIQAQVVPTLEEVRVDMADMRTDCRPVELVTSVGSCIAICMYDSANKSGGLAHIMLPDSNLAQHECLPFKFADTAVPALVEALQEVGKRDACLSVKIAGGANMFSAFKNNLLNIGAKNAEAVKISLKANGIRLSAEDIGGTHGRRVSFNVITGFMTVRSLSGEVKRL